MKLWKPGDRSPASQVATPELSCTLAQPEGTAPSTLNVTVPVGVGAPAGPDRFAVRVTGVATVALKSGDADSSMVAFACCT